MPVTEVAATATFILVRTVPTPTEVKPSMFLYEAEPIPEISTISPSEKPCGMVVTPVTTLPFTLKIVFFNTTSLVPMDTIFSPRTCSTSTSIDGSLKLICSPTL